MIRIHLKGDELQALEVALGALRKWAFDGKLPMLIVQNATVLPIRDKNPLLSIFAVTGKFKCRDVIVGFEFRLTRDELDGRPVQRINRLFTFEDKAVYEAEQPDLKARIGKNSRSGPEQALRLLQRRCLVTS